MSDAQMPATTEVQSSNVVLMVRPASFAYNPETAENNAFMSADTSELDASPSVLAMREFDGLVAALRSEGVQVIVVEDTRLPPKPDAVFPNNWFSTHADGTLVTYPMYAESRRLERLNGVQEAFAKTHLVHQHRHYEQAEDEAVFLEGTGSLVLDRLARVAYLVRSERSDEVLAKAWAKEMDYELVVFDATDPTGLPIYHTNVIMAIGTYEAILCADVCAAADVASVRQALGKRQLDIVEISWQQVNHFAGNALEVLDGQGRHRWAMSTSAYRALTPAQRQRLERRGAIIHADIATIEHIGGGSARCMIAEIYLPRL